MASTRRCRYCSRTRSVGDGNPRTNPKRPWRLDTEKFGGKIKQDILAANPTVLQHAIEKKAARAA